jgi:hypothetical protein
VRGFAALCDAGGRDGDTLTAYLWQNVTFTRSLGKSCSGARAGAIEVDVQREALAVLTRTSPMWWRVHDPDAAAGSP